MTELALFAILVGVVLVIGVRAGILIAPRLARLTDMTDEEPRGRD